MRRYAIIIALLAFFSLELVQPSGASVPSPAMAPLLPVEHPVSAESPQEAPSSPTAPVASTSAGSTAWTELGPKPIVTPAGTSYYGTAPFSGRVTAIAINSSNSQIIYLGAAQGGVWKSTDGGTTWAPLTDSQSTLAIGSITISPDSKTLYVGTGEPNHSSDSYAGVGILKSSDAGKTWSTLGSSAFSGSSISKILINQGSPSRILVSTTYGYCCNGFFRKYNQSALGVYLSTDGGNTWAATLTSHSVYGVSYSDLVANPAAPNTIYAASFNDTIWRSTDGGSTWSILLHLTNQNCATGLHCRVALAISAVLPNSLFSAWANDSGYLYGIYRYDTSTGSVIALSPPPNPPNNSDPCGHAQCNYDLVLAADPTNSNILYFGGVDLYESSNGGTSWIDLGGYAAGGIHPDQHALVFLPGSSSTIFSGNDGGIWKSTNRGTTWTNLNSGLAITQFDSIAGTPSTFLIGGTQDNGCDRYAGTTSWTQVTSGDGGWSGVEATDSNIVYCDYTYLNFQKSTDGGRTFADAVTGLNVNDKSGLFYAPAAQDPSTPGTVYIGSTHVYKTTNYAQSWTDVSGSLGTSRITVLAVAPSSSSTVFLGDNSGSVKVSTSGGVTWTVASTFAGYAITGLAVDPTSSSVVYVSLAGRQTIYKLTLQYGVWQQTAQGLAGDYVDVLRISSSKTLYAGTEHGVSYSADGGLTWASPGTGLPSVEVADLEITSSNQLIAATHGRGVWMVTPTPIQQIQLTISYSVQGGGSGYSAPVLTYTSNGSTQTLTLGSSASSVSADVGGTWSVSKALPGSSSTERWETNQATTGTAALAQTLTFTYYNQFKITGSYNLAGGGNPTAPTISSTSYGSANSTSLTTGVRSYWFDAGASWTVSNPLSGSGNTERWQSSAIVSGTLSAAATVNPTYYHQFLQTVSYSVSGGGNPAAPSLSYVAFGVTTTFTATGSGFGIWADNGGAWIFANPLGTSGPGQRWASVSGYSGTTSAAATLAPVFYNQYFVTVFYTLSGGGTYVAPTYTSTAFGSSTIYTATGSSAGVWTDSGATYTMTNPLTGSSATSSQRAATGSSVSGTISGPTTVNPTYYNQYLITVFYALNGGGTYAAPTYSTRTFGSATAYTATTSTKGVWTDNSASWTVTNPLTGSSATLDQRAATTNTVSGTISGLTTINPTYYNQFLVTVFYALSGGGTFTAPTYSASAFGSGTTYTAGGTAAGVWTDNAATYTMTNPLAGTSGTERAQASSGTSGTISGPAAVSPTYYHQYSETASYSVAGAGSPTAPIFSFIAFGSPTSFSVTASGTQAWADKGASWTFTNPLSSSTQSERWAASAGTSGSISSAATLSPTFYHQYSFSGSYSLTGGGSPAAPVLSSLQFGAAFTQSLATTPTMFWLDSAGSWSMTNPLTGSGSVERWDAATLTSGTVTGQINASPSYYHQYLLTFSYSVVGGGNPASPVLSSGQFGTAFTIGLTGTLTASWLDGSATWGITNPLSGSTSSERWDTATASGTVTSASTIAPSYYHQFGFTLTYAIQGGGSPAAPNLVSAQFGSQYSVALGTAATTFWLDSAAPWSVGSSVAGSGGTERWQTAPGQTVGGLVTGPSSGTIIYYHQYTCACSYSVSGGGTPTAPTLTSTQFGSPYSTPLASGINSTIWLDSSTSYSATNPLPGSVSSERWFTTTSSGTVSGAFSFAPVYAHQFTLTLQPTPTAGGTVSPASGFFNADSSVSISASANPGYQFGGWTGTGSGSYTGPSATASVSMNEAVTEVANFVPTTYTVTVNAQNFQVSVLSNSTVSGFAFSQQQKAITFTVSGTTGTQGYFNVTWAKTLLNGTITLTVDGTDHAFTLKQSGGTYSLYATYGHSQHSMVVSGTNVVPEFPQPAAVGSILLVALLLVTVAARYGLQLKVSRFKVIQE